jgi:hypothetical protein
MSTMKSAAIYENELRSLNGGCFLAEGKSSAMADMCCYLNRRGCFCMNLSHLPHRFFLNVGFYSVVGITVVISEKINICFSIKEAAGFLPV